MKKATPYIFTFLAILIMASCRSKTTAVYQSDTKIKIDSVHVTRETVTLPPILSSLTINEVCDSITNKPVKFKKQIIISGDTLDLWTENNDLRFSLKQAERLFKEKDSLVKLSESRETKTKIESITIYKMPKWGWWTIGIELGLIISFIAFPSIPKWIHRIILI